MKNIFSLLCFALFATALLAQNTTTWFPPGAKWKYEYESLSGPGTEIFEQVGMEDFQGHVCAKLHQYGYHEGWPTGPTDHGYKYLYAQNDSVFYWTDSSFKLLYDFTRQPGDVIVPPNGLYNSGTVDSVGIDTVFGIPVRFQQISLISMNVPDTLHTRVYERLGGQHLLYWDIESPLTEIQYSLTCYRDDEYPQFACNLLFDFTYHPFPENNATWSEEDASFCGFHGYQYKLEGDTLIFGVAQGKKLYARNTYAGSFGCPVPMPNVNLHEPFQLLGVLQQSALYKTLYFTRLAEHPIFGLCVTGFGNDHFPLHQPVLLYDFNLAVGDTIAWRDEPNVVLSIDSIQLKDGTWRRTFHFDEEGRYFWIEGIGSNMGLFGSYAHVNLTDSDCALHCFRENNQLKYPRESANDIFCDSILVATADPKDLSTQMKLYPNPANGAFTLEVPANAVPALARLFDAQGRELGRREITESVTHWSLPELGAAKMLFLHLQTTDKRAGGRMLRVE